MGTFGFTEAKRREPLPFVLRGPFGPAQVRFVEVWGDGWAMRLVEVLGWCCFWTCDRIFLLDSHFQKCTHSRSWSRRT